MKKLCPPDFNLAPPISRSWRRPCRNEYCSIFFYLWAPEPAQISFFLSNFDVIGTKEAEMGPYIVHVLGVAKQFYSF